jgi:hypothetical protein
MLTPIERALIEEAREILRTRERVTHICTALEMAQTPVKRKSDASFVEINHAYSRIRDWVGQKIYPCQTLGYWQQKKGFVRTATERRQDRINWFGYMLGEFDV